MAMGTRKQREKQEDIWIAYTKLPSAQGHPFYQQRIAKSSVGCWGSGRSWVGEGEADRNRCNDVGGERDDALDCAPRHGGELGGVSAWTGEGFGHRDAERGRLGTVGPQAEEADVE
jgi:hypothetical protein